MEHKKKGISAAVSHGMWKKWILWAECHNCRRTSKRPRDEELIHTLRTTYGHTALKLPTEDLGVTIVGQDNQESSIVQDVLPLQSRRTKMFSEYSHFLLPKKWIRCPSYVFVVNKACLNDTFEDRFPADEEINSHSCYNRGSETAWYPRSGVSHQP